MSSGYTYCKCRDCFEIVVSNDMENPDFCDECEKAGCEENQECQRQDAYGCDGWNEDSELNDRYMRACEKGKLDV